MDDRFTKKEALIYKKILLENDTTKKNELEANLAQEVRNRYGASFGEIEANAEKILEQRSHNPNAEKELTLSATIKKKLAEALSDDEFAEWLQSGGKMLPAVALSSQEMAFLKGGDGEEDETQPGKTVTPGCLCTLSVTSLMCVDPTGLKYAKTKR